MSGPNYRDILYTVDDPVATITLNRPDKLNAFTYSMLAELRDAIGRAAADSSVVGIVLTGAGHGFCAGLDAETLAENTSRPETTDRGTVSPEGETPGLFSSFLKVEKPIVAAVNGVAAGGGFVMALMSDIRIASPNAVFTSIFSKRGLIAEHGSTWILPRLVGAGRALDLLWTSRKVPAEEAERKGLVEFLSGPDDLVETAQAYVRDLAANVSPASIRETKRLVYDHLGIEYDPALREAHAATMASLHWPDSTEGVQSFVERRPPRFPRLGDT